MPPRRRQVGRAKEKKQITTRLMEISLKLDDYVYKQKPISAADARAHIQEILVYKAKCLKDERCLQVIEKLTRCMNAIIAEDQNFNVRETQDKIHETTNYSCPSPTYSLTDENEHLLLKAQDNEELNAVKSNEQILHYRQTQSHIVTNSDASKMRTKTVGNNDTETVTIDTIDLGAEDEERDHTFNVDVEMHRALSNLSIRGMQEDFNTAENVSQSILDNNTPDLIKTRCSNNVIPWIRTEKSNKSNSKIIDLTENENIYEPIDVKKVVRFDMKNTIAVSKTPSKSISKKNTQKRNNNSKRGLNKQTNNVEAKNKAKKKQVKKQIKTKNEDNKNDKSASILKTINSNAPKSTNLITTSTDLSCSARKLSGNNYNKILVSNVQQAKHDSVSKIYSDNTENDLSWVENIRFVREVQKEEIDNIKMTGLNESFWEDLSFF